MAQPLPMNLGCPVLWCWKGGSWCLPSPKSKVKRPALENRQGRGTQSSTSYLRVDVLQWYHRVVCARRRGEIEGLGHPPMRFFGEAMDKLTRDQSDELYHRQYCTMSNTRVALTLTLSLVLVVFVSWIDVSKPVQRISLFNLVLLISVEIMLARGLAIFRCFRERLILGVIMTTLAISVVSELLHFRNESNAELINYSEFGLWVLALLLSLSALVNSVMRPNIPDAGGGRIITKAGLLVMTAIIIIALLVGMLMYFVPFS